MEISWNFVSPKKWEPCPGYPTLSGIPYPLDTLPHKSLPSGCLTPWIPYPMDTIPSLDVLPPGYPNPSEPLDTLPSSSSYPTSYLLDTIPSLDVLPLGYLNPPNPWIPYPPDTLPPRSLPPGYHALRGCSAPYIPQSPPRTTKVSGAPSYWYAFLWYVYLIERDFEWNKFDGLNVFF